jgi:hypothetical protein
MLINGLIPTDQPEFVDCGINQPYHLLDAASACAFVIGPVHSAPRDAGRVPNLVEAGYEVIGFAKRTVTRPEEAIGLTPASEANAASEPAAASV